MIVGQFGRTFADYGSHLESLMIIPLTTQWEINKKTYSSESAIAVNKTGSNITAITYPIQNQPMAVKAVETPTSTTLSVETIGTPTSGGSPGSGGGSTVGSPGSGNAVTGAAPPSMASGAKFPWTWVIVGAVGVAAIAGVAVVASKKGGDKK